MRLPVVMFFCVLPIACTATPGAGTAWQPIPPVLQAASPSPDRESAVQQTSFAPGPAPTESPFSGQQELTADLVVEGVLLRHPSLVEMQASRDAAAARYPQATSLEDPMFAAWMAPATIDARPLNFAQRVELAQKVPYPGKLRLRGEGAAAEANAAEDDLADMRLQLTESACTAFADYFLVSRALAVNTEALRLLRELRGNAEVRYRNGQVPQQDVLQAKVEIGRQEERLLTLERMRKIAVARINTLLHLSPDSPLPPPADVQPGAELREAQDLRELALSHRPDLRALAHRADADQAALELADREFFPDTELMAAYDSFWQGKDDERSLRAQIGLRVNLPVRLERRRAAVAEARARLAGRQAAVARLTDQINFEVQQAYEQVRESEKAIALYHDTILPAAEANVREAQTAYLTGKVPFLNLIEAQRNVVNLRDRGYEVLADYVRRRAALERVVGGQGSHLQSTTAEKTP